MGHKNNLRKQKQNQKNNGGSNKHQQKYQYKEKSKKYTDDELVEEALMVQQILEKSEKQIQKQTEKTVYVIDIDWYYDWQEYIGYSDVVTGQNPTQGKYFNSKRPGKINEAIYETKDTKDFIKFPSSMEKQQYFNQITNSDYVVDRDTKLINQELWQFLYERYGGYEISRPVIETPDQKKKIVILDFIKPELFFIGDNEIQNIQKNYEEKGQSCYAGQKPHDIFDIKQIMLPKLYTQKNLKSTLEQYLKESKQYQNPEVKIWKIDSYITFAQLRVGVLDTIQNKKYLIKATDLTNDPFYQNLPVKKYLKNTHLLMIEIKSQQENNFIFQKSSLPMGPIKGPKFQDIEGYCESCVQVKVGLESRCHCKQAFYCSQECQYQDKKFHSQICELAYDSDDDEEVEKKQINAFDNKVKIGLTNIGNTCYMNSALQCIAASSNFTNFYTNNEYINQLKSKDKKDYRLTQKFSKLMKNLITFSQDQIIEPHAFKTQIGQICHLFSRDEQQDSQEFLNITIDALNQQLKCENDEENDKDNDNDKKEQENEDKQEEIKDNEQNSDCIEQYFDISKQYGESIKNSFLGLFKSVITCPECFNQSTNIEPFSIVSVPIAYKPQISYLQVFFVPIDYEEGIQMINIEYQENSDSLQTILNKVSNKINIKDIQEYLVPTGVTQDSKIVKVFEPNTFQAQSMKELKKKLEKNKFLAFYQIEKPYSSIEENESIIQLNMYHNTFVMQNYAQKTKVSIPRLLIVNNNTSTAQIYRMIIVKLGINYQDNIKQIEQLEKEGEIQKQQYLQQQKEEKEKENEQKKQKDKDQSSSEEEEQIIPEDQELYKQSLSDLPFNIQMLTEKKKKKKSNICQFCNTQCSNCILPFYNFRTLQQYKDQFSYSNTFNLELFWENSDKYKVPDYLKDQQFSITKMQNQDQKSSKNNKQINIKHLNCPSILECLQSFQEPEVLSEDNMWLCENCDVKQQAYKCLKIHQTGKNLILQIKRFRSNDKGEKVKNANLILYEEELDLGSIVNNVTPQNQTLFDLINEQKKEIIQNNPGYDEDKGPFPEIIYELYGVILHEGGINGGHYIAMCKHQEKWYQYNDDQIKELQKDQVTNHKDAYILFYKQKN